MKIRPYLTYSGDCVEAINLYKRAFGAEVLQIMRYKELSVDTFNFPVSYAEQVVQATIKIGDDFIRLSDCGPGARLNDPESERISLAIEASVSEVTHGFKVISEEGRVGIPLAETFYSPWAGVVFDKFGVMWNFIGQKD